MTATENIITLYLTFLLTLSQCRWKGHLRHYCDSKSIFSTFFDVFLQRWSNSDINTDF